MLRLGDLDFFSLQEVPGQPVLAVLAALEPMALGRMPLLVRSAVGQ